MTRLNADLLTTRVADGIADAISRADELLESVLHAHGGVDRWNTFEKVSAAFVTGGGLMPMKGINTNPKPLEGIATIHHESTVVSPFGKPDQRMVFTPERVVVETTSGAIVEERSNPRAAFAGHTLSTPWDLLHLAYFNGYARWTYLNTPFLLAMPGFAVTEIAPWHEESEVWRGLRARFPDGIASHSKEQDFYSATTSSSVVTITTWQLQVVFQSPSTYTTSWRPTASASHQNGALTCVGQSWGLCAIFSSSQLI